MSYTLEVDFLSRCLLAVLVTLGLAVTCSAESIAWYSVNSGGGTASSSEYTLQGTVGQPAVGVVTTPPYSSEPRVHYIGFWSGDLRAPSLASSIDSAKLMPEGTYLALSGLYATTESPGDFGNRLYLEAEDRSSGILFSHGSASVPTLAEGTQVSVIGTLKVLENGELALVGNQVTPLQTGVPRRPLGLRAAQVGGKNSGQPDLVGQRGTTGAVDLNNTGLLIRVWGRISGREAGTDYLLINDGSVAFDSLRIDPSELDFVPDSGFVQITGISSVEYRGTDLVPVVRPRRPADLVQLAAP